MSPDKEARAAALRAQLKAVAPEMYDFMDEMKRDFGATVIFVEAPGIQQGKAPEPGIVPHVPLPAATWPYKVGESARDLYKPNVQTQRKGRVKK